MKNKRKDDNILIISKINFSPLSLGYIEAEISGNQLSVNLDPELVLLEGTLISKLPPFGHLTLFMKPMTFCRTLDLIFPHYPRE